MADPKIILDELKKISGIESWLADMATQRDNPPSDRTENRESYDNGVKDTYLYLRQMISDHKI